MGIALVHKSMEPSCTRGLTGNERTVLTRMCATALDSKKKDKDGKELEPCLYFAGWELLAHALGYDELTPAAKEQVRRAVRGLEAKGLIERKGEAHKGARQVYRITLPK